MLVLVTKVPPGCYAAARHCFPCASEATHRHAVVFEGIVVVNVLDGGRGDGGGLGLLLHQAQHVGRQEVFGGASQLLPSLQGTGGEKGGKSGAVIYSFAIVNLFNAERSL